MMEIGPTGTNCQDPVPSPSKPPRQLRSSKVSIRQTNSSNRKSAQRVLVLMWLGVGILPLVLQARSYMKFVTPHKLTRTLVVPVEATSETINIAEICPVEGLFIASSWWNVATTHYYQVEHGHICHFVIPQYNIHGSYIQGVGTDQPLPTTLARCARESYSFEYYFYHGGIGYYAFYEEGVGKYCANDKTAYVHVRGLGTFDSNGSALAHDRGEVAYRNSYWIGFVGLLWIVYRAVLLRRSYVLCKHYGRKYDAMRESLSRNTAIVFVQESMRLTTPTTTNCFRFIILYLLLEGVMSDLFLLIAQDGPTAKIQYISLGYNLSGVLSMIFEIVESMKWMSERVRLLLKRLLFSYEISLLGELVSAGLMSFYLTWVNRSTLKESKPTALAVSYYVWGLVGHIVLVLGLVAFITFVRILSSSAYVLWHHQTLAVLTAPCSVDTTLGARGKMIMLGGYVWQNNTLYYKIEALKAFGILKMIADDGEEYFVIRSMRSAKTPSSDLIVIGSVSGAHVRPCTVRLCTGTVTFFDRRLGGPVKLNQKIRAAFADNKVHADSPLRNGASLQISVDY